MVFKCCVPHCRGNYDAGNRVHVFKFPVDEDLRRKWLNAIKRDHFVPTKNSVVCELHFNSHDIRRASTYNCDDGQEIKVPLKIPRLVTGAIPSVLPTNCPAYLNTKTNYRESPGEKRLRRENSNLRASIEQSIAEYSEYQNKISVKNLQELKDKLPQIELDNNWSVVVREKCIAFIQLELTSSPKLKCSFVINELLELKVYCGDTVIKKIGNFVFPSTVKTTEDVKNTLQELCVGFHSEKGSGEDSELLTFICDLLKNACFVNSKFNEPVKFIMEQIMLLTQKKNRIYSSSLLIISSMLFSISPHCYKYLRHLQLIKLPHPCTIRRLCASFKLNPQAENEGDQFLMYIRRKFSGNDEDKYVVLMMDEIHTKPMIDYKGGTIVGEAYNSSELATSAHCFMISSLLSNFKEIAHIVPVKSMCATNLQCILKKVIIGLETIGFQVICVVSDNNSINRKCMELFSLENVVKCVYPHPVDESRPLFFVFDSVHLLKCVRNNWINQKDERQCMNFPEWSNSSHTKIASFSCLNKLAELEKNELVKYSYGLSLKALCPTSMERQNVKLVLQVFNDNTIEGLKILGKKHNMLHCEDTAVYIRIILDWWEIVNVKTPGKGRRLNNTYMNPITNAENEQYQYLSKFLYWLKKWKCMNLRGSLSNETMNAITTTTEGFLKLIDYCLSELKFKCVLLGKFQTDSLECRFGQYRQLSGAVYNISMRQIYEVEKKIRIQSTISFKSNARGPIEITEFFEPELQPDMGTDDFIGSLNVNDSDLEACDEAVPLLVYLAGYCCHSVLNRLKCHFCRRIIVIEEQLIDIDDEAYCLIRNKSRGKLLHPQLPIVNIIMHNYVIISKLCSTFEERFLKVKNQRELALNATLQVVNEREIFWEEDTCENGHTSEDICKKLLWVSTNIFLNNYCKKKNLVPKVSSKRKHTTFNNC